VTFQLGARRAAKIFPVGGQEVFRMSITGCRRDGFDRLLVLFQKLLCQFHSRPVYELDWRSAVTQLKSGIRFMLIHPHAPANFSERESLVKMLDDVLVKSLEERGFGGCKAMGHGNPFE
jgi:hypothetical protein